MQAVVLLDPIGPSQVGPRADLWPLRHGRERLQRLAKQMAVAQDAIGVMFGFGT